MYTGLTYENFKNLVQKVMGKNPPPDLCREIEEVIRNPTDPRMARCTERIHAFTQQLRDGGATPARQAKPAKPAARAAGFRVPMRLVWLALALALPHLVYLAAGVQCDLGVQIGCDIQSAMAILVAGVWVYKFFEYLQPILTMLDLLHRLFSLVAWCCQGGMSLLRGAPAPAGATPEQAPPAAARECIKAEDLCERPAGAVDPEELRQAVMSVVKEVLSKDLQAAKPGDPGSLDKMQRLLQVNTQRLDELEAKQAGLASGLSRLDKVQKDVRGMEKGLKAVAADLSKHGQEASRWHSALYSRLDQQAASVAAIGAAQGWQELALNGSYAILTLVLLATTAGMAFFPYMTTPAARVWALVARVRRGGLWGLCKVGLGSLCLVCGGLGLFVLLGPYLSCAVLCVALVCASFYNFFRAVASESGAVRQMIGLCVREEFAPLCTSHKLITAPAAATVFVAKTDLDKAIDERLSRHLETMSATSDEDGVPGGPTSRAPSASRPRRGRT